MTLIALTPLLDPVLGQNMKLGLCVERNGNKYFCWRNPPLFRSVFSPLFALRGDSLLWIWWKRTKHLLLCLLETFFGIVFLKLVLHWHYSRFISREEIYDNHLRLQFVYTVICHAFLTVGVKLPGLLFFRDLHFRDLNIGIYRVVSMERKRLQ